MHLDQSASSTCHVPVTYCVRRSTFNLCHLRTIIHPCAASGTFSKPRRRRQRERGETKDLRSRATAQHTNLLPHQQHTQCHMTNNTKSSTYLKTQPRLNRTSIMKQSFLLCSSHHHCTNMNPMVLICLSPLFDLLIASFPHVLLKSGWPPVPNPILELQLVQLRLLLPIKPILALEFCVGDPL
ncbi:hypothetical protein pdam_00011062 [Pocillopora damicornis]|uniref:Uncharacterized protein n=1 Tax=Pocillopora damicornis TaxID=46731 RepID=A0A3M6UTC8_POCDA|nr:hypothetical protein pdam_00011062 [Pocillopora damicornis]